ncbi:MAG: 50S ribosomal protein L5 [Candidatus Woesebacteria bacterium GW2011_GWB1_41_10]|uniref:Large ribosomal subunit protein uL5 n=1 Tax=Candidatus Woesebacteria bacterium GW2011_GWB1_41_10 TaxID=1618577 RepID=A0A0G0UB37_9BACT|nr:MAG: 50S ribosomal protein L5 [Candidatus Woesebacteria bacterium GW2011_GWB1_41_10]
MNRLLEKYRKEISPKLADPKITKVVINAGVGELAKNQQGLEALKRDLAAITGQTPSIRLAKKSIAAFGVREGVPVGLSVTLRGVRMFSFLDRLFSITLPRLRDFRGISDTSFDKFGNYTLGMPEHTVFPEIDFSKSTFPHGIEITIVTTAKDKEKARKLLELLGCPFVKN